MSKIGDLREALSCPSTTGELAAILGWPVKLTCAHLRNEMLKGKVRRELFPTGDKRVKWLWMKNGL